MYPVLFQLGPFTVRSYGLFVALAFVSGIYMASYRADKRKIDTGVILNIFILAIFSSIIGARIAHVIISYKDFIDDPVKVFYINQGGLVFYGGAIAGISAVACYVKLRGLEFLKIADIFTPSLPLGHAFGRIGCFLNGCCYGDYTNACTGVIFNDDKIPRHPTQLYEALFCVIIFFILLHIEKYFKKSGYLFVAYIYMYSAWRFSVEFVRGDDRGAFILGLSPSQNISLLGAIFATALLVQITRNGGGAKIKTGSATKSK